MGSYDHSDLNSFVLRPRNGRFKRFYVQDLVTCLEVLPQNGGFLTSRMLSDTKGIPRRTANHRISKLVKLTILKRHGRTRCPYQWYDLNEKTEILQFLRKISRFFAQNPKRIYLEDQFLNSLLRTWQSMKRETGSVPFGFPQKIWDRKSRTWRRWKKASKYDSWLIRTDPFYAGMVLEAYREARSRYNCSWLIDFDYLGLFYLDEYELGFTESDLIWLSDNVKDQWILDLNTPSIYA